MVFGVLAGINSRVLAGEAGLADLCSLTVEACCYDDSAAAAGQDVHHQDNDECPPDHHHHHFGCCSHAMPLTVENNFTCRLGIPGPSLSGIRHESEVPPDEPFLGSEKPPLI